MDGTRKEFGNPDPERHHVFSFFYLGFLAPNLYKWVYNLDYVQKPGE